MAESLGAAVLTVTVDQQQFNAGLDAAKSKANAAAGSITRSFDGVAGSLRGLAGIAGLVGIGAFAQQLIQTGQESQRSSIQLKSLTAAYGETGKAAEAVTRVQNVLGISTLDAQRGFAQLFAALRGTGLTLDQIEVLFVGVSNAARLSGAGAQEAAAGLLQLKQGLASGRLQGDELRSVLEQFPALAQAIASELGVNVGKLRDLGSQGKITSEVIFNAAKQLATASAPGKTEIDKLSVAFSNLKVQIAQTFGPALSGVVTTAANSFAALGTFVENNKEKLRFFGRSVIEVAKTLAPFLIGIYAVRQAFQAWQLAVKGAALAQAALLALSGPGGLAILAAGAAATTAAAILLEKGLKGVSEAAKKSASDAKKAGKEFSKILGNTNLDGDPVVDPVTFTQANTKRAQLTTDAIKSQIAIARQLATAEGTDLVRLQNKQNLEEQIRASKAAQLDLSQELAKPIGDGKNGTRTAASVDNLLNKVEEANLNVIKAYEEAGGALEKNARQAASELKNAQQGMEGTLRGGFEFLTPELQRQQLSRARASIQPLIDRGVIRQGINISTPDQLFNVASFAESFNRSETELVKAQQENTKALTALTGKDTNVTVVVRQEGTQVFSEVLTQAIS